MTSSDMGAALASLQEARLAIKRARREKREGHPFGTHLADEVRQKLYDDGSAADAVLVVFPGQADKMGAIATAELFDQVADLPIRRLLVRELEAVGSGAHPLGASIDEVAANLAELVAPHQRKVFVGASIGGFFALLFGTLAGAETILVTGPTTCLLPEFLASIDDHRYDDLVAALPGGWLERYGDPSSLWDTMPRPPSVLLHYGYRYDGLRAHAERIAERPNVTPLPHLEMSHMAKIRDNGVLRAQLRAALLD